MTDPELIPKWWGPHGTTTHVEEMDVELGGRWRFVCESEDGTHGFSGTFRELDAAERSCRRSSGTECPATSRSTRSSSRTWATDHACLATSTFHFPEERDGMLASGMESGMGETYDRLEELLETL